MKLTGKTKEEFEQWLIIEMFYLPKEPLGELFTNALVIEFLDTIQYKDEPLFKFCFSFYWHHRIESQSFNHICIQSIIKANEIFNLNNK